MRHVCRSVLKRISRPHSRVTNGGVFVSVDKSDRRGDSHRCVVRRQPRDDFSAYIREQVYKAMIRQGLI